MNRREIADKLGVVLRRSEESSGWNTPMVIPLWFDAWAF